MQTLEELRARIDEVDERMAELLEERSALAKPAAEVKRAHGLPTEDPQREAQILAMHGKKFQGVAREDYLRFQKTVLQISKEAQKR